MRSTVLLFPLLLLATGGGSELDPADSAAPPPAEGWMGLVPLSDTDLVVPRHGRHVARADSARIPTDRPACPMPVARPPEGLLIPTPVAPVPSAPQSLPQIHHDSSQAGLAAMPMVPSGCVSPLFSSEDSTR
jgi:hypothetical protein